MEFVNKDVVMVYDTDYQGVAHYASYYRFVTNALYAFRNAYLDDLVEKHGIWFVIAESHAVYKKPLHAGEKIEVKITPKLLSNKSIRFDFKIYRSEELTTEGYLVQVAISKESWHSVELPEEIKKILQ